MGWGLPCVLNGDLNGNPNLILSTTDVHALGSCDDIGPQLPHRGILSSPNKPLGFVSSCFRIFGALPKSRDLLGYLFELSGAVEIRRIGFRFKMGELSLAGLIEAYGGQPETDGGNAQYDRKGSYDGLVVVLSLDPLKPSFAEQKRSSNEGGAVILIIVVGGLLIVLRLNQAQR